jgi:GntR family transcriptional regulator, transcriptional repressor for pyruvate dehydrogenase complex
MTAQFGADGNRAYEDVIAYVRNLLISGDLQPGDRLPGERDLAEALEISRPMIREALRTLEVLGVVSARRGNAPSAGTVVLKGPSPALATLLDMEFALERFDLSDVIDTRIMLERWAIASISRDADLSVVEQALQDMGRTQDRAELVSLDLAFHSAIVESSHNQLVAHLYRSLRGAMHQRLIMSLADVSAPAWKSFWRKIMDEHIAIFDAVSSGSLDLAAELSEQHVTRHYLK